MKSAERANVSPESAALAIEQWFEQIRLELMAGHYVKLCGFGMFAPVAREDKTGELRRCYPRFVPSRGLANEVRICCAPSEKTEPRNHPRPNWKETVDKVKPPLPVRKNFLEEERTARLLEICRKNMEQMKRC